MNGCEHSPEDESKLVTQSAISLLTNVQLCRAARSVKTTCLANGDLLSLAFNACSGWMDVLRKPVGIKNISVSAIAIDVVIIPPLLE